MAESSKIPSTSQDYRDTAIQMVWDSYGCSYIVLCTIVRGCMKGAATVHKSHVQKRNFEARVHEGC